MHGAGTDFHVERHLDHAAALRPEILQAQDEVLEGDPRHSRGIICALAFPSCRWVEKAGSCLCPSSARLSTWLLPRSCQWSSALSVSPAALPYPCCSSEERVA